MFDSFDDSKSESIAVSINNVEVIATLNDLRSILGIKNE